MRVALSIEVLGVDSRDEASIARDALVADLVCGAVHPRDARLAHVATRSSLLRLFRGAIHRGRPHLVSHVVTKDCRSSVTHAWSAHSVPEVLTSATIALTSSVTYNVLLLRNMSGITRNL